MLFSRSSASRWKGMASIDHKSLRRPCCAALWLQLQGLSSCKSAREEAERVKRRHVPGVGGGRREMEDGLAELRGGDLDLEARVDGPVLCPVRGRDRGK
eukprot:84565-Hanusia_phi.AAC.1